MSRPVDRRINRGGPAAGSVARRLAYREERDQHVHPSGRAAFEVAALQPDGGDMATARQSSNALAPVDDGRTTRGLAAGPAWVSTPTSERILAGLRYAQLAADIVVIYGGAGLGKTHAIRHYRSRSPNVFHVELSPATGGLIACLEEIAIAVGLSGYARTAAYLHRAICVRLRGANGLLVFDEAQELNMQALDQVRCIHDRAKVGIALVGNERVYAQMAGSNRAAYLDRLYSRIGKRIHLRRSSEGDAAAVISAWGITDNPSRGRLLEIAGKPGALRVLSKALRLADTYAQAEGRKVNRDDIDAAWYDLGGLD